MSAWKELRGEVTNATRLWAAVKKASICGSPCFMQVTISG
jgi:hypothetical protein